MRKNRRLVLGALSTILLLWFSATLASGLQQTSNADLLKAADEVLQKVVALRGLDLRGKIQKGVKTREEIARYLDQRVKAEYEIAEVQREGRVLQKLGLIPAAIDYRDFTLKLLTEQVGGYYDPEKKTFFIAGWLGPDLQKPVMAHELTHALQDQHFDLKPFIKRDRKAENDDRKLAQLAVIEGDGLAVMLEYSLQPMGRDFTQLPNLVGVMRSQLSLMDTQYPTFHEAPLYLKESLLFPYSYGASFLQAARLQGPWSVVNRIYSDLPQSTEQIIHPEKYFKERDNPKPVAIEDPGPLLGKGWKTTYRNVLGEFGLYLLLRLYLSDDQALRASSGWGGDKILYVEEGSGAKSAIFMETVWDSANDATEFVEALDAWLRNRVKEGTKSDESAAGFVIAGDREYNRVQRRDTTVRLILGMPLGDQQKLAGFWR